MFGYTRGNIGCVQHIKNGSYIAYLCGYRNGNEKIGYAEGGAEARPPVRTT